MQRTTAVAIIVAVAIVVAVLLVLCGPALTSATEGPSASPSPSATHTATPPPVVIPASADLVHWANRWRRAAVRQWTKWNRARWCLEMHHKPFASPRPPRSADKATWDAAGKKWRAMCRDYHHRFGILWERMVHPHGNAWERWRPLVRWVWPANLVNTVISIIHYESSGNARVLCGGYVLPAGAGDGEPDSRAGGLMQNKPAPRHWADPFFNLWYAYWHKYVAAGYSWSPWAGCAAF